MSGPRVYVTRRIPQPGLELLRAQCSVEVNPEDRPLSRQELLEKVRSIDGLLCLLNDRIDAQVLDAAAGLKGIANLAVGYDNIDVAEVTRRGIPASNTPGVLTDATAEMAWALLFALGRRVVESDKYLRAGKWGGWGPLQFIGADVSGSTLGIVGAGRIGTAMALKSRGFGMRVLYRDQEPKPVLEEALGAQLVDLDTLLAEADFISIHVALTPETRHLFGRREFQKMKPTACLINTARGAVVNEGELLQALRTGQIAGAALDVFEREPVLTQGLGDLDNVVLTPHTASATRSARTRMATMAAGNLLAMLAGRPAANCINPEVYQ